MPSQSTDWLIHPHLEPTALRSTTDGLILSNGLIERHFLLRSSAFCTIDLRGSRRYTARTFLRALSPEANMSLRARGGVYDGQLAVFRVGGCVGTPRLPGTMYAQAQVLDPAWISRLAADEEAFQYVSHSTSEPEENFPWTPGRFGAPSVPWPPRGLHLTVNFRPPKSAPVPFASVRAALHYEMYDGLPVLRKWIEVWNLAPEQSEHVHDFGRSGNVGLTEIHQAPPLVGGSIRAPVTIHSGMHLHTGKAGYAEKIGIEIDSLEYELLRAPNFAPEHMSIITQHANNPLPMDDQASWQPLYGVAVGLSGLLACDGGASRVQVPPIPGVPGTREQQFWFDDADYDAPKDKELHARWTFFTRLSVGYTDSRVYGGPTGPGVLLTPGGPAFESLSVRLVLHDSSDIERKGLTLRECYSKLAPHLSESPIMFMANNVSGFELNATGPQNLSPSLRVAIDQASATGVELVIIGFGAAGWCGLCKSQRESAAFRRWFKSHVVYGRERNVSLSAYTLMQHNGWGMDPIPLDAQTLNRDGSRGPTACFATDWHAEYRHSLLGFVAAVGMTGLETDGQYEAIACADESHGHHHNGVLGGWSKGLQATFDFNIRLKQLGVYQTGADAYIWSGANRWNHADNDMLGALPLWERHTLGRIYNYDSTITRLPSSGSIPAGKMVEETAIRTSTSTNLLANNESSPPSPPVITACGPNGTTPRLQCLDFLLAGYFFYGTPPYQHASSLFPPDDPLAPQIASILRKWSDFFLAHRAPRPSGAPGLALSRLLHLRRPSLRDLEIAALVTPDASAPARALMGVLNPTGSPVSEAVSLPLYYTGLAPGAVVTVTPLHLTPRGVEVRSNRLDVAIHAHGTVHVLGEADSGFTDIMVNVNLNPVDYVAYEVSVGKPSSTILSPSVAH